MNNEPLQHDPRTKKQIKDLLFDFLYEPVQRRFKERLEAITIKNALMCKYSHKSFMYRNVLYNCDPSQPLPRKMNRLHLQLHGEMNDYLRELKELNEKEVPFVLGYITQTLNSSNDLHDYLRLLPPVVHAPVHEIIASCPCRSKSLPEETVQLLLKKNQSTIELIKQRIVTNLLI